MESHHHDVAPFCFPTLPKFLWESLENIEKIVIFANENTNKGENMPTKTIRRRRLTPEENRAHNASKPALNKSMQAFRTHRGELKVYDPALLM